MQPVTPSASSSHRRLHVVEVVQAAARDHRHGERLRELARGLDVHAGHHPVAPDVGVDHRLDAVVLEALGEVDHVVAGELGPAVGGDLAVLRVEAHDDVPGEGVARLVQETRVLDRGRADDHVDTPSSR